MSRLLDANKDELENSDELSLRPQKLSQYIGQDDLKKNLKVFIGAAKKRDETLDHLLFYGPPGLGKTTLAYIIANEMNANIVVTSGPAYEKGGDMVLVLNAIKPGDILFIDEIHRLPKSCEEILYSAMEDFVVQIINKNNPESNGVNLEVPPFTLIGATTRAGDLSSPLRARFGFVERLNYYSVKELNEIVKRTANVFSSDISDEAALEIAKRSRGTPRIAIRLFKRVRDFANYNNSNKINYDDAINALNALKVDDIGLDDVDIRYLKTLINRFNGGPVGLDTLASAIGEESTNLEDVYEPYLLQIGFIDKTPKGRVANEKAYEHLKLPHQNKLF